MTPHHDDRIELLVAEALGDDEPEAALERACEAHPDDADRLRSVFAQLRKYHLVAEPLGTEPTRSSLGGFELIERIGRGGMGVVYRARDPELGRQVALKVLRPELLHFDDSRDRFRREIDAVSRLRHPGIVSVHRAGEDDGVPFFTMELVEGASLAELLAGMRGRPLATLQGSDLVPAGATSPSGSSSSSRRLSESWPLACAEVARMIAMALQHAHDEGVFHRDVKPSNVLVDAHGRALLLDFGLARLDDAQRITRSTSVLGSLAYLPPECIEGGAAHGARQDVYSLGVTLYEMLTLRCPFAGPTLEATRARVEAGDVPSPRAINRAVSRDLATVCMTAMDRNPERRYASVSALAEDLDAVLERRPIRARPAGPLLRATRFVQRHPTRSATIALSLVIAAISSLAALNARRATEAEHSAREDLVDANLRFVFEFAQGLERIPGNTEVRVELLDRAVEQLARFEVDPELDARRLRAIGGAHLALARAAGKPDAASVGQEDAAVARHEHVLEAIVPRLRAGAPADAAALEGRALVELAVLARFAGDHARAFGLQQRAIDALEPHLDVREVEDLWLTVRSQLASIAGSQGRHEEALAGFELVRARWRSRAAADPGDERAERWTALEGANVGRALYGLGEHDRAADEYAAHVDYLDRQLGGAPDDGRRMFERVRGAVSYPEILITAGRLEAAIAECERTTALCEELRAADPANVTLPDLHLHLLYGLGWAHQDLATRLRDDRAGDDRVLAELRAARTSLAAALELSRELAAAGKLRQHVKTERIAGRLAEVEALLGP